jgi:hypothetical protein
MLKKLAVLMAAVAVSAPAFADRGQHRGHGQYARNYPVQHRPVVVQHYYRPAPRPVYVVHRAPPRPVVYQQVHHYSHPNTGIAILAGAIIGAAIMHHAVTGY